MKEATSGSRSLTARMRMFLLLMFAAVCRIDQGIASIRAHYTARAATRLHERNSSMVQRQHREVQGSKGLLGLYLAAREAASVTGAPLTRCACRVYASACRGACR